MKHYRIGGIMNTLNVTGYLSSYLKWCGVLFAAYEYQNSKWVSIALMVTVLAMMLEKLINKLVNSKIDELELSKSIEWSYLNAIRLRAEKSGAVDPDLLKRSKDASNEADEKYKSIYGFYRPATAFHLAKKSN